MGCQLPCAAVGERNGPSRRHRIRYLMMSTPCQFWNHLGEKCPKPAAMMVKTPGQGEWKGVCKGCWGNVRKGGHGWSVRPIQEGAWEDELGIQDPGLQSDPVEYYYARFILWFRVDENGKPNWDNPHFADDEPTGPLFTPIIGDWKVVENRYDDETLAYTDDPASWKVEWHAELSPEEYREFIKEYELEFDKADHTEMEVRSPDGRVAAVYNFPQDPYWWNYGGWTPVLMGDLFIAEPYGPPKESDDPWGDRVRDMLDEGWEESGIQDPGMDPVDHGMTDDYEDYQRARAQDEEGVGEPGRYKGYAYFWDKQYQLLRDASIADRRRVHDAWLAAGLDLLGAGPEHERILREILPPDVSKGWL